MSSKVPEATILAVVEQLIGPTAPVCDSSIDEKRLKNLDDLRWVTTELVTNIIKTYENHYNGEWSVKQSNDSVVAAVKSIHELTGYFLQEVNNDQDIL